MITPTKCWSCRRPGTCSCLWDASRACLPVPGWRATPTLLRDETGAYSIPSYHVIECPLYLEDPRAAQPQGRPGLLSIGQPEGYLAEGRGDETIAEGDGAVPVRGGAKTTKAPAGAEGEGP